MKTKINIFILLFFLFGVSFHPVHISLLSINLNSLENKFEAILKVNTNDLQTVVSKGHGELNEGRLDYIKENLRFSSKNIQLIYTIQFDSSDLDSDYFYLQGSLLNLNQITISNNLITTLYPDQKNILTIKDAKQEKGVVLDSKNSEITIDFE